MLSEPSFSSGLTKDTSIQDYSVSVTSPGDSISFTFDVVNEGNYNASITKIDIGTPTADTTNQTDKENLEKHLKYELTYNYGSKVQVGDTLYAKETNTMRLTLTYDNTVTAEELLSEQSTISNLGISISFEQEGNALVKENTGEVADGKVYKIGNKIV